MRQLIEAESERLLLTAVSQDRFYRPELDGLRFYAFIGVFLCHTLPLETRFYDGLHLPAPWLWAAVVRSGAAGVDLFFVLSAFLITSLLLREREQTGQISLPRFYIRRILRIWPLYFLLVALGVALACATPRGSRFWYYDPGLPWQYVVGYIFFVANWVYAALGITHSVCAPLWTISIEEQFYLIWPAFMKMLKRRGMIVAAIATFLLAIVSQLGLVATHASASYVYYGSASRSGSLALGILLALFLDRLPKLSGTQRGLLLAAGLIGCVASSARVSDFVGYANLRMGFDRLVISLAASAILYACLYSQSRLVTGTPVVRLGKISYGLYMLHSAGLLLVLSLFHPAWGWELLAVKVLGLAMTILLAFLSYRWVESPFLRMKNRFATVLSRPV